MRIKKTLGNKWLFTIRPKPIHFDASDIMGGHARPIRNHQKLIPGASWAENFWNLGVGTHGEEAFVSPTLKVKHALKLLLQLPIRVGDLALS